jgi:hypothetical protein
LLNGEEKRRKEKKYPIYDRVFSEEKRREENPIGDWVLNLANTEQKKREFPIENPRGVDVR